MRREALDKKSSFRENLAIFDAHKIFWAPGCIAIDYWSPIEALARSSPPPPLQFWGTLPSPPLPPAQLIVRFSPAQTDPAFAVPLLCTETN